MRPLALTVYLSTLQLPRRFEAPLVGASFPYLLSSAEAALILSANTTLTRPGAGRGPEDAVSKKANKRDRFPATMGFIVYEKPVDRLTETMMISAGDTCCKENEPWCSRECRQGRWDPLRIRRGGEKPLRSWHPRPE